MGVTTRYIAMSHFATPLELCFVFNQRKNASVEKLFSRDHFPILISCSQLRFSTKSDVNRRYASYNLRVKCDTE